MASAAADADGIPPETVLILGATGSAGRLAVQNAQVLGATTVVAVGRDAAGLAEAERLGATRAVQLGGADDAAVIADVLATHPPTVVLDFLWGTPAETTLRALAGRGMQHAAPPVTYVEIGESAGSTIALSGGVLRSRAITIVGSGGGSIRPEELAVQVPTYAGLLTSGRVQIPTTTYALSEVGTAWSEHSSARRAVIVP